MKVKLNGAAVCATPALFQVLPPFELYSNWTFFRPLPPVSEAVAVSIGLFTFVGPEGAVMVTFRLALPIENDTGDEVVLCCLPFRWRQHTGLALNCQLNAVPKVKLNGEEVSAEPTLFQVVPLLALYWNMNARIGRCRRSCPRRRGRDVGFVLAGEGAIGQGRHRER